MYAKEEKIEYFDNFEQFLCKDKADQTLYDDHVHLNHRGLKKYEKSVKMVISSQLETLPKVF